MSVTSAYGGVSVTTAGSPAAAPGAASARWRRLRDLFGEVQDLPESERAAFLDRELAGEPELRAELDSILGSASTAGTFLAPRASGATSEAGPEASLALGSMVGPYRLVERIGEGGFGVVYLAEQERPIRRRVALKLIKPGMDTRQVIARFESDRYDLILRAQQAVVDAIFCAA